jgi:hypothetical protein
MGPKKHKQTGRYNESNDIYTPYFYITTNNRYDALSNQMDYSPRKDAATVMHGQRSTKKLKNPHYTDIVQNNNYTEYPLMASKNGKNHHTYKSVNRLEENMKLQLEPVNIPVVINGCVLGTKNTSTIPIKKEVPLNESILKDLYDELLEDRSSIPNDKKHKVLIIGDSHLREYSANIKTYLSDQFQVNGFIKPGAGTKIILGQITNEIENLLTSDFIILSCGSNDVGRIGLGEIFSDIVNFIKKVTHTKVILLTIPVRYDLEGENSNINNEIVKFNMKLSKLSKLFSHLHVLDVDDNRHFYTKHGFHLNGLGKKKTSLKLAHLIFSIIKKINNLSSNIIPMGYYEIQSQLPKQTCSTDDTLPQNITEGSRSKRIRKKASNKNK